MSRRLGKFEVLLILMDEDSLSCVWAYITPG